MNIAERLLNLTTPENFNEIIEDLDNIYNLGMHASTNVINDEMKALIFWTTLQEDVNYPPPRLGRKMPFQRYYEALLSSRNVITWNEVQNRTNNHGGRRPQLLNIDDLEGIPKPSFYN